MKFSKFISYFFHPINFPIIGALLYFLFLPKFIYKPMEYSILGVVFVGTYVFPIFFLFLLKRLGMIQNFHLNTIEERKFPIVIFIGVSWIIGKWLLQSSVVDLLSLLFFGFGLSLIFSYLLLYIKLKVSLHTVAIGGLIGFLIYFSFYYRLNMVVIFSILFILSGFIGTSRLRLKAHKTSEVFLGFLIGVCAQFIVYFIYNLSL